MKLWKYTLILSAHQNSEKMIIKDTKFLTQISIKSYIRKDDPLVPQLRNYYILGPVGQGFRGRELTLISRGNFGLCARKQLHHTLQCAIYVLCGGLFH